MILRDFYAEESKPLEEGPRPRSEAWSIANPFDRLAAQALDIGVIFFPLFTLVAAPLKRQIVESYLLGDWKNITLLCTHFIFAFFSVYLAVCFFSQLFFKTTFGKRLLGLKVINIWNGQPPTLWEHTLRSVYIFFQLIFAGLPLLLVLTNKKHRGMHDQLTDSMVLSEGVSVFGPLTIWPIRSFLRLTAIGFIAFSVPTFIKAFSSTLNYLELERVFDSPLIQNSPICEKAEGLDQAMALVASGYMETDCLKEYAEDDFVDGANPSALSYLAKSFLYVNDPELSDRYLKKVCRSESDSAACVLAQFISSWSDGSMERVESVLEKGKEYNEPFLNLWALRYYQQAGHYRRSLEFSKGLTEHPQIGVYVKTQSLKAKYFLGDAKASDNDLVQMSQEFESPVILDTMAWSCLKKISSSCKEASHPFCRAVMESDKSENIYQPRVLLGKVRLEECSGESPTSREYLAKGQSKAWTSFIYALSKEKRGDIKSSWSIYSDLVKEDSTPDYLKAEAIRRMALNPELSDVQDLEGLVSEIETFEDRKDSAKAVATVFYKLDLMDIAQSLSKEYNLSIPETDSTRLPASVEEESQ